MTEKQIANGRYTWELRYRHLRGDEGLSVRLLGPVENQTKELARFDCFKETPHYHTAVHDHNTIRPIEESDPVAWFLSHVGQDFTELVARSGGDAPTDQESRRHNDIVSALATQSKELVAEATAASA